ncbi:hypothetical protein OK024_09105 [Acinetobacter sp. UGAL515B_02]|nr:hypothetical protein [Acinetobacter sp. UGAL515B_02]WON79135.1 hypothetical protein OK024_09105 [Acinetobacter sp. UGAL515B_02]
MTNLTEVQNEDNREFLVGDLVVLTMDGTTDILLEVVNHMYTPKMYRVKILATGQFGPAFHTDIRHATIAEINAKRRLTATEQALGEVS